MNKKRGRKTLKLGQRKIVRSIRFSPEQIIYFKKITKLILQTTDIKVTKTWIIKRMMAFGQDRFHKEFDIDFEMIENVDLKNDNNLKIMKRR